MTIEPADSAIKVSTESRLDAIGKDDWNALWKRSAVPTVFCRYEWSHAWSSSVGRHDETRVYAARLNGRLVGLLPTIWPAAGSADRFPVKLVGDEQADYAAILTEAGISGATPALLEAVCRDLPRGGRLILRDVRSDTPYASHLAAASASTASHWRLALRIACPRTSLTPARLQDLIGKDSLKRHTRKLAKLGTVEVRHCDRAADILPRLDAFFSQHIARWAPTPFPSLFADESMRQLYKFLAAELTDSGQLVFTEVRLEGAAVAFHFGFISEGDLVWYKPSFDPALSRVAPGEVLLRELLLLAGERGLTGFDFTRGDEAFKRRFADSERTAETYIYYSSAAAAIAARGIAGLKSIVKGLLPKPMLSTIRRWVRH